MGLGALTHAEIIGLNSYLLFLRHRYGGRCTTRDCINLSYYRDGHLIGQEKFVDATGLMSDCTLQDGKVVPPADEQVVRKYPSDFPKEVFAEIVPPLLIETGIMERWANQVLDPKPPRGVGRH